jgi:hypothetical protein
MHQVHTQSAAAQQSSKPPKPIIVVVQLQGAKIYVAVVEALKKNERQDETLSLPPKLMVFGVSSPVEC